MLYKVFDDELDCRGQFTSIYDLERYIDGIREGMGDQYPHTERSSCFDYIKKIGWCIEIDDHLMTA